MNQEHTRTADEVRRRIAAGTHDRSAFRAALLAVPYDRRDLWIDRVLDLDVPPDDGPEVPPGCVPYLPCSVDALLEVVDRAAIDATDTFVDIGSGVGRAMALVHLLTGAAAIGIEIQTALVEVARAVTRPVSRQITTVHGDATRLAELATGSVYFLYCPFGGDRLQRVLSDLQAIARTRPIRICCVDLPLPERDWLTAAPAASGNVTVHRSTRDPA